MGRGPGSEQGQGRVCGQGLEIQEGSLDRRSGVWVGSEGIQVGIP